MPAAPPAPAARVPPLPAAAPPLPAAGRRAGPAPAPPTFWELPLDPAVRVAMPRAPAPPLMAAVLPALLPVAPSAPATASEPAAPAEPPTAAVCAGSPVLALSPEQPAEAANIRGEQSAARRASLWTRASTNDWFAVMHGCDATQASELTEMRAVGRASPRCAATLCGVRDLVTTSAIHGSSLSPPTCCASGARRGGIGGGGMPGPSAPSAMMKMRAIRASPRSARRNQCAIEISLQAVSGRSATGQVAPLSAGAHSCEDTRAATRRVAPTARTLEAGQLVAMRSSCARASEPRSSFEKRAAVGGRMVARRGAGPERRPARSRRLEPTRRARVWQPTAMRTPTPRESIGCRIPCAYIVGDAS
jgi:hypothetical protein